MSRIHGDQNIYLLSWGKKKKLVCAFRCKPTIRINFKFIKGEYDKSLFSLNAHWGKKLFTTWLAARGYKGRQHVKASKQLHPCRAPLIPKL